MPLPPSSIEQITREPVRSPGWSGNLLMFSATIFIIAILAYGGLKLQYERSLDNKIQETKEIIETNKNEIAKLNTDKLVSYSSRIKNLEKLIEQHAYVSNVLSFIESSVVSGVYFGRMEYMSEPSRVALTGYGKSVEDVTRQVRYFESHPDVASVSFSNVFASEKGEWQFDATVTFKEGFITRKTSVETQTRPSISITTPSSTTSTVSGSANNNLR